jgi:hypothetical protein
MNNIVLLFVLIELKNRNKNKFDKLLIIFIKITAYFNFISHNNQ